MPEVSVALGERSYNIIIESGVLDRAGEILSGVIRPGNVAVVSQKAVWELYGQRLENSLNRAGVKHIVCLVPNGEGAKRISWLQRLYSQFARGGIERSGTVVALGGGAVGDLAGFAAASWLRGVDFVQIPTTLLAQVDASVGGKVGVNLPVGKNLVGAFWQPRSVIIDPGTLNSLSDRDLRCGLAEVIKYGIILDTEFFEFVRQKREALLTRDANALEFAIKRSCELKAYVVCNDERESGLRAILNYGHTIAHVVEKVDGYGRTRHGEAVAIGMTLAARLAVKTGMINQKTADEIRDVLIDYGLPTEVPARLDLDAMMSAMVLDKKASGGRPRFILPTKIGEVKLVDTVTPEMARDVIKSSQSNGRNV